LAATQNLEGPFPIRLGTVLRWIRIGVFDVSLSDIIGDFFEAKPDTEDVIKGKRGKKGKDDDSLPLSAPTWSGYELGTRFPSKKVAVDLVHTIGRVLPQKTWPSEAIPLLEKYNDVVAWQQSFVAALLSFYNMEQVLRQLEGYYPLRHLGTQVLAYALLDDPATLATEPYPPEYFVAEDVGDKHALVKNAFRSWVLDDDAAEFRKNFARWLLKSNQVISKKYIGSHLSTANAEQLVRDAKNNKYPYFPNQNIKHFCAEATRYGLFFEQPGPSYDAIMAFGEELTLSNDLRLLKVQVITPSGNRREVKVDALWADV
jgi:hypothetical protein